MSTQMTTLMAITSRREAALPFRIRKDGRPVDFGLAEYDGMEWQRVSGLLITPFQIVNS